MDKNEQARGLLKEVVQEELGSKVDEISAKAEESREASAKALESNQELKARFDAWQDKSFKMKGNTGENLYVFKGYDINHPGRNFKAVMSKEAHDEVAGTIVKALTNANTGAYAIPVEYGSALLGLAELSSYALNRCRVIRYPGEVMYLPAKGTRATVDAQAFGTANAAAATTLSRLTFTIDKRVGDYEEIYDNVLRQANFDVVGEFVEPVMAEAIGQKFDGYMFDCGGSTEFTTNVVDNGTSGATFSGTLADNKITYSGLIDCEFAVEFERGVNPEWVMPRGVAKYVRKLVDSNGLPLWDRAMEGPGLRGNGGSLMGYPVYIVGTGAISATPADGQLAIAFGDPRRYIIGINQNLMFEVNPYIKRKEGITQFIMHATADGNIEAATAWATYTRDDTP